MSLTAPAPSALGTALSQSPVDIRPQAIDVSALPPLRLRHPGRLSLRLSFERPKRHRPDCLRPEEGSVKAEPPLGQDCLMSIGDATYHLEDIHWHTPSEHTVGGVVFPMEQHLKYARTTGDGDRDGAGAKEYAVLGVFLHPGDANGSLDRLLESARRSEEHWDVPDVEIDTLLPPCTESYRYVGSTTTCPYTTGVRWTVLTHPVQASAAALEHYRSLFPEGNAREVQPLGKRRIAGDSHRWW
ncbi:MULTISPECIES: carbonic anhydrase family protein [Streptomyces]|uniref:carbonic anhydrase n=1 Tax=Streptomyces koelreuteriae TaxID=2838015 RepID=A0ABX8FK48_9ACTN|nr:MULTISPECIES: carbonic anhydrase family protein [Streptomyces]QWB21503.1 carbonic anhydrase family protein [Streptomyces koelreuteriae]UUA04424.1 carbonic anhydrase family protein [Streptomyces koelreuteriae]UUA12049.1 carbonic anhydrase family protein [Streptomyces sp. CRCS-T-1]